MKWNPIESIPIGPEVIVKMKTGRVTKVWLTTEKEYNTEISQPLSDDLIPIGWILMPED